MIRRLFLAVVGCALLLIVVGDQAAGAQQSGNLIRNPGFEDGFFRWNGINEINVAHEWTPWWIEDLDHEPTYHKPEFKEALARDFPTRVRSGERAQQWFKLYSSYIAGIHQQVFNVTPGQNYRFSIWAQVWSSTEDNPSTVSTLPANPHLQIGIDPTGLWNPFSPDIIWSEEAPMYRVIDQYGQVSVEATAQTDTITVFVRAIPEFANKHNNIYLDDAELVLVGPPPPPPTSTPLPASATPVASPTPEATATSPATNTPMPTDTPPPTATLPPPTETALPTETAPPTLPNPTESPALETVAPTDSADQAVSAADPSEVEQPAVSPTLDASSETEPTDESTGSNLCASPLLALALFGMVFRRKRQSSELK